MEEAKSSKESYYYWSRTCFNLMEKYTQNIQLILSFLTKHVLEECIEKDLWF